MPVTLPVRMPPRKFQQFEDEFELSDHARIARPSKEEPTTPGTPTTPAFGPTPGSSTTLNPQSLPPSNGSSSAPRVKAKWTQNATSNFSGRRGKLFTMTGTTKAGTD